MKLFQRCGRIFPRIRLQRCCFSEVAPSTDGLQIKRQIVDYLNSVQSSIQAGKEETNTNFGQKTQQLFQKFEALPWDQKKEFLSCFADSFNSQYEKLWPMIHQQPQGMQSLLTIRENLLVALREKKDDQQLASMNNSLRTLLASWFTTESLQFQRITHEDPPILLNKIVHYSQIIHGIRNWAELKTRLGYGHRCYAFFHEQLPQDPLVFIEVALTKEISSRISDCVNPSDLKESEANTAIFYAIISTQKGLGGIDLGHHLIMRVVAQLKKEFSGITTFSTLSPMPGFRTWLDTALKFEAQPNKFSKEDPLLDVEQQKAFSQAEDGSGALQAFEKELHSNWINDIATQRKLELPLTKLMARYLIKTRKRSSALDPVANFHLGNGAIVHRINYMADRSDRGMKESYGAMVNYLYEVNELHERAQQYSTNHIIQASKVVNQLLQRAKE